MFSMFVFYTVVIPSNMINTGVTVFLIYATAVVCGLILEENGKLNPTGAVGRSFLPIMQPFLFSERGGWS